MENGAKLLYFPLHQGMHVVQQEKSALLIFLTVSDDHWKINKANVISRQLGFSDACQAHGCSRSGQGSGPIWME